MGRKFTKIPNDTFESLTIGAGLLAKAFDTEKGEVKDADLLGATSGGLQFSHTHEFVDFGEDIDNCAKNTKELKEINDTTTKVSGTMLTMKAETIARLIIGDVDEDNAKHIVPRNVLKDSDFADLWIVANYGKTDGGAVAIHMMNTLSTAGFAMQTTDKNKGQYAFEFTAHYSMSDQDTVPVEVFIG